MSGHRSYLVYLLGWTLPVIAAQLTVLGIRLRDRMGSVLRAVALPVVAVTAWLSAADHLAIRAGIWRFSAEKTLGLTFGVVPVEEVLFFLLTNTLVALGLALFSLPVRGGRSDAS